MATAQDLFQRVAFLERETIHDNMGNTNGEKLIEKGQCRAAYRHLRGGESVMASRLEGRHVQVITVRASSLTRQITTDWIVRDVRASSETAPGSGKFTGDVFNIRDVTLENGRQWISLLVEKGVAV